MDKNSENCLNLPSEVEEENTEENTEENVEE